MFPINLERWSLLLNVSFHSNSPELHLSFPPFVRLWSIVLFLSHWFVALITSSNNQNALSKANTRNQMDIYWIGCVNIHWFSLNIWQMLLFVVWAQYLLSDMKVCEVYVWVFMCVKVRVCDTKTKRLIVKRKNRVDWVLAWNWRMNMKLTIQSATVNSYVWCLVAFRFILFFVEGRTSDLFLVIYERR